MVIKLLKVLFKYVLVLLLIIVVVGLLLPQDYRVSKHVEINANTSTIKTLVADFNQWHTWSPWQQVDPTIEFIVNEIDSLPDMSNFYANEFRERVTEILLDAHAESFHYLPPPSVGITPTVILTHKRHLRKWDIPS